MFTSPRPENDLLGKYYESKDYTSHTIKNQGLVDMVYRTARTFTLQWKYRLVTKETTKQWLSIMDYGCGTGEFLNYCQEKGHHVQGIEPNHQAGEIARAKGLNVESKISNNNNPAFDTITLWHVLEHIPDLNEVLTQLHQMLDSKGKVFIAVPNRESADAKHYQDNWAAYDVPRHLWHFSKNNIQMLFEKHGFILDDIIPMKLDAYYVSLLSEKYKRGSTTLVTMVKAFYQGAISNYQAKENTNYSSLIYKLSKK
ncbi:class I SAM-dependent methyltransferase [Chryseosolibacter indicus]|nr:class I SAM-dependent methyltransferase [Chryseosolibacter indicus]